MDLLQISALSAMTHVGIHDWEQRIRQKLLIDVKIPIDLTAVNNQLTNTIDYQALCECITSYVESTSFSLIETVAENVSALIKEKFNIKELTLTVSKPQAIKNASNISVTIHR